MASSLTATLTTTTATYKSPYHHLHRNPQFQFLKQQSPHKLVAIRNGKKPFFQSIIEQTIVKASSSPSGSSSSPSGGLYSAQKFDLTIKNVDFVLEDVRPYLIADGGNVEVVSVDDGVISLKLQGACGSCPSSNTTMTMGIERVLKEKFGDAVKEIRQVDPFEPGETTVEAVNGHLDILRPAIKNYGGSVEVLSIGGGDCHVKYIGPESIGSGIKAAIKERFPDIVNVLLTN